MQSHKKYQDMLKNPDPAARGMTRWWWYGCAATEETVRSQLAAMSEAGIGGVELQILYPLSPDLPSRGIVNHDFFSPDFFHILKFTAELCKEMGMRFDLTLGSSWPYGGPFVPQELAMQCVVPYQIDLHGPATYSADMTTRFVGDIAAASLGKMEHCVMLPETAVDCTGAFTDRYLFGWVWGAKIDPIEIPEGDWKLCFYVVHRYRQPVGKPAPNADGPVIDHCSRKATDMFLQNMGQPIVDRLGRGLIDSFFCDSIECDGHNWSSELLSAFSARRGYDLQKYIYALWGDMGEITPHVRYDYFLTMSELTIENFFIPLTEWCHGNGSRSRIQAHGTWGDILKVYAAADQPEGETFGDHRTLECNSIHRRMAASAGHLYGRNVISNETFTWLIKPRFTETPQDLKLAVDAAFVDGVNMIFNHGLSLAHDAPGEPEWSFYASCHISPDVPWWPHYKSLGRYIHCVSALLQYGSPHVEVGIYLPQTDVWAEDMLSDIHLAMKLEEKIGRKAADNINKAGYWFDYLNDEALTGLAAPAEGGFQIGGNTYRVILLMNCFRLPPESAAALERFVDAGGILIAAGGVPGDSCGLVNREQRREAVDGAMSRCLEKGMAVVPDTGASLVDALRARFDSDVNIDAREQVGYVHRVEGQNHIYFIANVSDSPVTAKIQFKNRCGGCVAFDAGDQSELMPEAFEVSHTSHGSPCALLTLRLDACDSVVVIFPEDMAAKDTRVKAATHEKNSILTLEGWSLRIEELDMCFDMEAPHTWENIPGLRHYSGAGIYETHFDLQNIPKRAVLELAELYCCADVILNGRNMGNIWRQPYRLDITQGLLPGENRLEIHVASTLLNKKLDPSLEIADLPIVIDHWPYFGNVINNNRSVRLNMRDDAVAGPVPSGLAGGVRLELILPD